MLILKYVDYKTHAKLVFHQQDWITQSLIAKCSNKQNHA